MTVRGYLLVLSLQIFVIDYGTMTGRGYLCNKFWHELSVEAPNLKQGAFLGFFAMNGRGYLWVLSLHFFSLTIDNGTMTVRGYGTMSDSGTILQSTMEL